MELLTDPKSHEEHLSTRGLRHSTLHYRDAKRKYDVSSATMKSLRGLWTIDMTKKRMEKNKGFEIYTKEDYEKDLIHSDVLICYQKMLAEKIGYPVTLGDAEQVAYGWGGTSESRTEQIRQKYALEATKAQDTSI